MFGSARRKAVAQVVQNLQPLIGIHRQHYGIPVGFWQAPFVVGFIGFLASMHLRLASQGRLSETDVGFAMAEIFSALSNINGAEIMRNFTKLAMDQDADFNLGADNATLFGGYGLNVLKDERMYPLLQEIKQKMPMAKRDDVAGILFQSLFVKEVEERFRRG